MRIVTVFFLVASSLVTSSSAQYKSPVHIGGTSVMGSFANVKEDSYFDQWKNGFLLVWTSLPAKTGQLSLYDSGIQLHKAVSFHIPEATQISTAAADMRASGDFVVAGYAKNERGVIARFVASVSSDGTVKSIVRTGAYQAKAVCAANDGSVWTIGEEWISPGHPKQDGYSVLRQYSMEKGLLQVALKKEAFRENELAFQMAVAGRLQCQENRIRFFSYETLQWFEFDLKTHVLKQDDLESFPSNQVQVTGVAVTAHGQVLISIQDLSSVQQARVFQLTERGKDGQRHLIPLDGTTCSPGKMCILSILGVEGDKLIYLGSDAGGEEIFKSVLSEN
jgi:hypothetical protein